MLVPPGRGALGKTIIAIAVELRQPKGFGRCRLAVMPNVRAQSLRAFLLANVQPGSTIVSDGYGSYPAATGSDYVHRPINISKAGAQAHILLPGVHRIAGLLKRWVLGTLHGSVEADHVQAYLDEFAFRWNRRSSETRAMLFYRLLEQAVRTTPTAYTDLVVASRPKRSHPVLPPVRRAASDTLVRTPLDRPWRAEATA